MKMKNYFEKMQKQKDIKTTIISKVVENKLKISLKFVLLKRLKRNEAIGILLTNSN